MDLTSTEFLQKCLNQHTQNANESLHSKLWFKCLKVKHCFLARVKFAAADTFETQFWTVQRPFISSSECADRGCCRRFAQVRQLASDFQPTFSLSRWSRGAVRRLPGQCLPTLSTPPNTPTLTSGGLFY